jgi:hypothetical protein
MDRTLQRRGFLAAVALLAPMRPADAQAYRSLMPLLIDLPGWTGAPPEGVDLTPQGVAAVTASREYERGDAELNAMIGIGPTFAPFQALGSFQVQTQDHAMRSRTIDGFRVFTTSIAPARAGTVMVAVDPASTRPNGFMLQYEGVSTDQAVALARRFDWRAMQARLRNLR